MKLTVIIRDLSPFIHLQDPCNYRSVHIDLTPEQLHKLAMSSDESIGQCFIEND